MTDTIRRKILTTMQSYMTGHPLISHLQYTIQKKTSCMSASSIPERLRFLCPYMYRFLNAIQKNEWRFNWADFLEEKRFYLILRSVGVNVWFFYVSWI